MRLRAGAATRIAIAIGLTMLAGELPAQEIQCDPGDVEVRDLEFVGNRTFSDAELSAGIVTTASGRLYRYVRFLGSRRCLDPLQLPLDSLRVVVYYRNRGFYKATVGLDTATVAAGALSVTFTITEGVPVTIRSLAVTGLDGVPDSSRIVRGLPVKVGDRFDKDRVAEAAAYIRASLQNSGYPTADALQNLQVDTTTNSAVVAYDVIPGTRAWIGDIRIRVADGSEQKIDDPVVRRLLGFRVGDLYSAQKLVDARRFLFQTRAYRHVSIDIIRDSAAASLPDSLVAVGILVAEGTLRDLRVGVGWGTLDCVRTQATANDRNFLGGARQMEVSGRISKIGIGHPLDGAEGICTPEVKRDPYSDTLNFRVSATIRQPGLWGLGPRNVPSLTGYSERRSEYLTYMRSVPIGGVASLSRELRPGITAGLSYQLEYGRTEAQPAIYCALFNLCGEEEREQVGESRRLAIASLRVSRERQGILGASSSLRLDFRHASTAIFSDPTLEFNTVLADGRRYWTFDNGVELAMRLNGGVVLGNRISLEDQNVSDYVPPQERLYAGGPNSVRGFPFNQLGPITYVVDTFDIVTEDGETYYRAIQGDATGLPDDAPVDRRPRIVPTGGNTLVVGNIEARLPSPFLRDLLRYTLFVDAGQVCNRELQGAPGGCSLSDVRVTPGVGIWVTSPIGPIRVDVGYNPYPRPEGVAYYTFRSEADAQAAPLYCVSPLNTRRIIPGDPATQDPGGDCGATWRPAQPRNFFQRLTVQFSIGPAF